MRQHHLHSKDWTTNIAGWCLWYILLWGLFIGSGQKLEFSACFPRNCAWRIQDHQVVQRLGSYLKLSLKTIHWVVISWDIRCHLNKIILMCWHITSKHGKFRLRIAMSIFTWNVYVSTCCWKSKWSKWFVNIFHDTLRNLHEFYMCYQVLANWKSIILSHCSTSRCIHGFDERTCNSR